MIPRATVIIPTFRRPRLLARALASVLGQTYEGVRACVYDNASGDETEDVVAAIAANDGRVLYRRQLHNIGAFDNFVDGMSRVDTEFFSFLSDDDVLFPEFIATAIAALDQNPDAMMFAGSTLELSQDGKLRYAPIARWPREGRYEPPVGARYMLGNKHPTWTGVLFRRDVIDRVGVLDRAAGASCDLDYELQIGAHFPIVISFAPCAAFVRHAQAGSYREDTSVISGYRRIAAKFQEDRSLAPDVRDRIARAIETQIRLKLAEIAVKAVVRGEDDVARDSLALLRRERSTLTAALLGITLPVCMRLPTARGMLAAAEALRLQLRASRSARASAQMWSGGRFEEHLPAWASLLSTDAPSAIAGSRKSP